MPVNPLPCDDGGSTPPVEVTTCCAPSIASAPLCRADGTTVLAVVRSGCVECGQAAEDPAVVGWLDTAGTFTPGALPADAGPCEAGCVDTICRQLCDDADGDGEADTTYSELWCIRANGAAELVLTYRDDPSVPYVPLAPVECTYGCPEAETVTLCDDSGPFLRRYTWLQGVATFEDFALDGQTPHVVTGTVGVCDSTEPCEAQTTPAATLGLCLADGTPIAVVVTRDCDGVVTQDGWINLVTGTYSAGDPPAGTMACGNPRSISTTGTFCDVDPASGDVLGLVLIEYTYGADGAVAAVRLVDATTGQTYTPQGEVTTCPVGVEQPERDLVQLCDVAADGTATAFVRDYARDENGQITGHTDYLLDGAPYTPTGTVGLCPAESACRNCTSYVLCDTDAASPATVTGTAASGTLPNGVSWTATGPSAFPPNTQGDGAAWWGNGLFPNPVVPLTTYTFDQPVTVDFSVVILFGPGTAPGQNTAQLPVGAVPLSLPSGYTYDRATGILTADATLADCALLNSPTREGSARFRVAGVSSFALRYLGPRSLLADCRRLGNWLFGALDVSLGGTFLRTVCRDCDGMVTSITDTLLDGATPYTPVGLVGVCQPPSAETEPCRDTSSTLLCDTAVTDVLTVFDPANRASADGWEVVSFTGANPGYGPEQAMPYPARYGTPMGYPALGARADQSAGSGGGNWSGYDAAPVRWILRKTFQAPQDGVAVAQSVGFRGDGGARVRINGIDAGMYGQWNKPATSGTAQVPVSAGPNTVEIEVRDTNGVNNVVGRLDIAMPRTVQFLRHQTVDCATGEVIATRDTTLDGAPYEVTGTVGQCEPVAECCEQPPPETRLDVETALLCVRDQTSGGILGQVIAERVYDDQSGDLAEQRLTDLDGAPYTLPAGAELTKCPSPDRITRQVCVVESGSSEFLTNAANAASGQDTDWTWSPNLAGPWHPMYRVAANPVWTAADTAPNAAHWVSPHSNRTVCPAAGETSPPVPGTWYTRASWNLPVDVSPDSIRIAATVLNADNKVVQWRLNDGAWQPVGGGALGAPAWTFPPTAVPGGRAGQNDVVVQITETQPAVSCPSPNEAGMILHVIATYDHAPQVWTQVIEPSGHTYYLDENGDRQDSIPAGRRLVACGGGGDAPCCPQEPDCPVAFSTECVGAVTRTEASYDNTSLIGGLPGQCGSVQGPGGQFPCLPSSGAYTITSWVVNGVEVIAEGGGRAFNGGVCGPGTAGAPGMHLNWSQALTNLDPTGATWSVKSEPACAFFVGSTGGTQTVYGPMTVQDAAGQQWILGPAQACVETQFTKVYTQQCDGSVTVSWLDPQGVETEAPEGDLVPCGTGCGAGGGQGLDVETLTLCDVQADGTAVPFLRHLTYGSAGQVTVVIDTALDGFAPYTPTGAVGRCQVEGRDVELLPMCVVDNATGAVIQRVLAEVTYDTATGDRLGVNYVDPLTWGPVAVPGGTHFDLCPEAQPAEEPCRNSSTLLVCDLPGDGEPATTVTDTSPDPYDATTPGTDPVTGGAAALWSGGVLTIPPDTTAASDGSVQRLRTFAATVQADRPGCDTGTATVTASIRVERDGPDPGCLGTGLLALLVGGTQVAAQGVTPNSVPVGTVQTLTVTAEVPAGDLAAGNVALVGRLETYHLAPSGCPGTGPGGARVGGWIADAFTASVVYDQTGCAAQVFATVVTDCETGAVESVTYTLPDGTPYTPQGTIGQCEAAGGSCCPEAPCPARSVIEQCRCDDTDGDGVPDVGYVELLAVDCTGQVTSIGTYTEGMTEPYAPVAPVDCNADDQEGADPAFGVQARRIELAAGASWSAAAWPTLQSVTAVAHSGTGTITTADGASTLHAGEAATWSVGRDTDAALTGPLTITAGTGTVTLTYTIGVTL
ncbi:hypothetical protein ACWEFD_18145 [Streptomyces ardesiacus]